ncbi:heavy-metal-associated domain-containing protein [uncultured Campylobacter sp.]|uniref:heavy-metal-associated domain-containing protein n=1 Tax=uncultured Campylobacter sp. TaxID=218934 RepID=UPI00262524BA|nr:heavy-metal-associated domain-containing protein [uncultured Campylobacter sp.]
MKKFKVANISCNNCANTIKNALKDEFGNIEVDVANAIVSLEIQNSQVSDFCAKLDELGFEVIEEL